jgi:hypothetical protein
LIESIIDDDATASTAGTPDTSPASERDGSEEPGADPESGNDLGDFDPE